MYIGGETGPSKIWIKGSLSITREPAVRSTFVWSKILHATNYAKTVGSMDIIMELQGLLELYVAVILIIVGSIIIINIYTSCVDGSSQTNNEKET